MTVKVRVAGLPYPTLPYPTMDFCQRCTGSGFRVGSLTMMSCQRCKGGAGMPDRSRSPPPSSPAILLGRLSSSPMMEDWRTVCRREGGRGAGGGEGPTSRDVCACVCICVCVCIPYVYVYVYVRGGGRGFSSAGRGGRAFSSAGRGGAGGQVDEDEGRP